MPGLNLSSFCTFAIRHHHHNCLAGVRKESERAISIRLHSMRICAHNNRYLVLAYMCLLAANLVGKPCAYLMIEVGWGVALIQTGSKCIEIEFRLPRFHANVVCIVVDDFQLADISVLCSACIHYLVLHKNAVIMLICVWPGIVAANRKRFKYISIQERNVNTDSDKRNKQW